MFVILLYQMWIYKTDKARINEFGQQFDDDEVATVDAAQEQKEAAPKEVQGKLKAPIESKKDI